MKSLGVYLCAVILLAAVAATPATPEPVAAPLPCYCPVWNVAVIDGDTFRISTIELPWGVGLRDQTVRANDFDAWETSRRRRSVIVTEDEIEKGHAAESAVRELFREAQAIYVSPGPKDRDVYGRLLASVTVIDKAGKRVDVGQWMRANGHCRKMETADE